MFYNIFSVCSTLFILQLMKIKILLKPEIRLGKIVSTVKMNTCVVEVSIENNLY